MIIGLPAVLYYFPLGPIAGWAARIGSWAVLLGLLLVGLAAIYRFGPSRTEPLWRWVTPGSLVGALMLLAASAAFSLYVTHFASYNETYGALGGVIILLVWLYISAFVVLLGAELNAELAPARARHDHRPATADRATSWLFRGPCHPAGSAGRPRGPRPSPEPLGKAPRGPAPPVAGGSERDLADIRRPVYGGDPPLSQDPSPALGSHILDLVS